jgi:type II secretory pathway pseudopilin PulG
MVASAKEHIDMHLQGQGGTRREGRRWRSDRGYAMAALLVSLAVMGILASVALPVWKQQAKREREAELIFRAGQYAHAIELFKRKTANQYPPDLDILVKQKFLRKKYKDPMTKNGEWRIVTPAELSGTPGANIPGGMPGVGTVPGGPGQGSSAFGRSSFGSGSSSGFGQSGPGFGQTGQPGSMPSSSPGSGFSQSASSYANQEPGSNLPGQASRLGGVNAGPVAAVASRSSEKSVRIFKGQDRYDKWIVTIEDVMKRQMVNPQQPQQPGQAPGGRTPTPSSQPSFGSGTTNRPGTGRQ